MGLLRQNGYTVEKTFGKTSWIYLDGEIVPWDDAKVHVLSHGLQYASSVFEGIRTYRVGDEIRIFRGLDHLRRLIDSASVYHMHIDQTAEELLDICVALITKNEYAGTYLRPHIFRGYGEVGVNPLSTRPVVMIAYWDWGPYLGKDALEQGIRLEISPFRRIAADTLPPMAKASANYANGQLAKAHAVLNGFSDALILDREGNWCEGTGMNLFAVHQGQLWTPPLSSCILEGCNRDTVIWIAQQLGIRVREEGIPMMFHHSCTEVFATGAASEVTPVVEIDHAGIADGKPGPITRKIQGVFFDIIRGRLRMPGNVPEEWFTTLPVLSRESAAVV